MGKASRAKQERRGAKGARTTEEVLARLQSMKPDEVLVRSFFPTSEAQTTATTPKEMLEESLRHDDMLGVMIAKLSCDIMRHSILDFEYPGVPGFFSDSQGSVYDVAFHYGSADCLRFLCKEGFERNHAVLLEIAGRLYEEIDDISVESPNYLPASVVVETYLRELVRRYGIDFAKEHVAASDAEGRLICRRALDIVSGIANELNATDAESFEEGL